MNMNEYYFNFSESLNEQNGTLTNVRGNPIIQFNPQTGYDSCYFDGNSAIELPAVSFTNRNFTIECIFRNEDRDKEQGVFGSNGFRLAYRLEKNNLDTFTFWANFPSSIHPKKITHKLSPIEAGGEKYVIITKLQNIYRLYHNGRFIGSLDYAYDYWTMPLYLGYYYDPIYSFRGYIREFKISLDKVLTNPILGQIPDTLRGTNNYELG